MGAREPMCWCVNPGVAGGRPGGEELSLVGDGGVLRRVLGGDCCCSCDRLQMGGGGGRSFPKGGEAVRQSRGPEQASVRMEPINQCSPAASH